MFYNLFVLGLTGEVNMDPRADREPNYALWSFGPDQTEFKPVLKVRMSAPPQEVKSK